MINKKNSYFRHGDHLLSESGKIKTAKEEPWHYHQGLQMCTQFSKLSNKQQ
jgi:hypothetical protein